MIQFARSRHRGKKLVTQTARGVFEIPTVPARLTGDIDAVVYKFDAKCFSKFLDKTFVVIRFRSSKLMMKMEDENSDPKFIL